MVYKTVPPTFCGGSALCGWLDNLFVCLFVCFLVFAVVVVVVIVVVFFASSPYGKERLKAAQQSSCPNFCVRKSTEENQRKHLHSSW